MERSFLPRSKNARPSQDISTPLLGGPTDWEAAAELGIWTVTLETDPPLPTRRRRAFGSGPPGVLPLKTFLARPSQKVSTLKTELIDVGVLRPVTWRLSRKVALGVTAPASWALPGTMLLKFLSTTPCDPRRSSDWIGKRLAVIVPPTAASSKTPSGPGCVVLTTRASAPALKWHVAQAWIPSPPVWDSQNSDLPSTTAAASSLTKSRRFAGRGTRIELRGWASPPSARGGGAADDTPAAHHAAIEIGRNGTRHRTTRNMSLPPATGMDLR